MKPILGVCLLAWTTCGVVAAQDFTGPVLQQQGVHVRLPEVKQAVPLPAADGADATVITITAEGEIYAGTQLTDVAAIAGLRAPSIYVKADALASFEQVLTVLTALGNRQVILLTQPPALAEAGKRLPSYGVSVAVGQQ